MSPRRAIPAVAPLLLLMLGSWLARDLLLDTWLWNSLLARHGHLAPGAVAAACCLVFLRFGRIEPTLITLGPLAVGGLGLAAVLTWGAGTQTPASWLGVLVGSSLAVLHASALTSWHLRCWVRQRPADAWGSFAAGLLTCLGFLILGTGLRADLAVVGTSGLLSFGCLALPAQLLIPIKMRALLAGRGPNACPSLRGLKGAAFVVWTMAGGGLWYLLSTHWRVPAAERRQAAIEAIHRISVRVWTGVPNGTMLIHDADKVSAPGILVANHAAMGEVPGILSVVHPCVTLVKGWVSKTPIMGHMTRAAEYIDTDRGSAEDVLEATRRAIAAGSSVLVFPEGTRTRGWTVGRFHNGAFAMARALGVKVTPIAIANARSMIGAGRWWIGDYAIEVQFLEPMDPAEFTGELADKRMAREARDRIRDAIAELWPKTQAGPDWWRPIAGMYRYLGAVVSHYAASKLRRDPLVRALPTLCTGEGPVLHAACGYGIMTSRLATAFPLREITGLDYDRRKIRVASAALGESTATRYRVADLRSSDLGRPETILLVDLLHYWTPEQQTLIVTRLVDALSPGGRLVFRDGVLGAAGHRSVAFFERVAALLRFTRVPGPLQFRSEADYRSLLEGAGLTIESSHPELGLGSNLVWVCRKPDPEAT